jgi:prepilin-type N-terminal cleavage/methylation domain-containing protein
VMRPPPTAQRGFTLIELSIVLVIIGLIVGGILVGQSLIAAAGVRGTISQIEKYQTAVNTFRGKYGGLPGDLNASSASQFGFAARGTFAGEGDGNGVIEGNSDGLPGTNRGVWESIGETVTFWVDLSTAGLIDNSFSRASETTWTSGVPITPTSNPNLSAYFPTAKIGRGNYIYVWSGGLSNADGTNYFGLSALTGVSAGGGGVSSQPALTVQEAYSIDAKIDDGLPQYGNVTALYVEDNLASSVMWAPASNTVAEGAHGLNNIPTTTATPWATTNCYDNNNVAGPQTYSVAQNSSQINCGLSFRFQ